jgi:hypothetical protein
LAKTSRLSCHRFHPWAPSEPATPLATFEASVGRCAGPVLPRARDRPPAPTRFRALTRLCARPARGLPKRGQRVNSVAARRLGRSIATPQQRTQDGYLRRAQMHWLAEFVGYRSWPPDLAREMMSAC